MNWSAECPFLVTISSLHLLGLDFIELLSAQSMNDLTRFSELSLRTLSTGGFFRRLRQPDVDIVVLGMVTNGAVPAKVLVIKQLCESGRLRLTTECH